MDHGLVALCIGVPLAEAHQCTELPDHGSPSTGVRINSLGSLHPNQYKQVGNCPAPCCEVLDRGLPHNKQCIRNDHRSRMGNPAIKTHTGKTSHGVQEHPQPY